MKLEYFLIMALGKPGVKGGSIPLQLEVEGHLLFEFFDTLAHVQDLVGRTVKGTLQ